MPSLAHQRHHPGDRRLVEAGELGVVDRDVGDPAGAVARQGRARHLADDARGRRRRPRGVGLARRRVCGVFGAHRASPSRDQRDRAVLGHHRGERHVAAIGSLQPIGRPVIAITGMPAARKAASAATAPIGICALGGQRVVDVGQHAARSRSRPGSQRAQGCTEGGITEDHKSRCAPRIAAAIECRQLSKERCKVRPPGRPRLGTASIATALTRTIVLVGEFHLPSAASSVRVPHPRLEP